VVGEESLGIIPSCRCHPYLPREGREVLYIARPIMQPLNYISPQHPRRDVEGKLSALGGTVSMQVMPEKALRLRGDSRGSTDFRQKIHGGPRQRGTNLQGTIQHAVESLSNLQLATVDPSGYPKRQVMTGTSHAVWQLLYYVIHSVVDGPGQPASLVGSTVT
jgi:hypothetical protein